MRLGGFDGCEPPFSNGLCQPKLNISLRQIHLDIWTNTFDNSEKLILQS